MAERELADFDVDGHLHTCRDRPGTCDCAAHLYAIAQDAEASLSGHAPGNPPRPTPGKDEDGYPATPEGWSSVILGTNTDTDAVEVLAGWTADGTFVQYAPTEAIVTVCVEALHGLSEPMETDEHRYGGGE